jgi:hypothetical protein
MRGTYVTALKSLKIANNLGRGDRINGQFYITNDKTTIRGLVPRPYVPIIGILEAKFIEEANAVIWGNIDFDDKAEPLEVLYEQIHQTHGFLQSIWLFLDNSVDTELGFLLYNRGGFPTASSSYMDVHISNARGEISDITLSRHELQGVRKFYREHIESESFRPHPATKVTRSADRISRALYHLQAARTTRDVAMKVVDFCTAFETLFATSQAELAHQLSELVAWFLEETGAARLQLYRDMKKIYALRSRVTHGSAVAESSFEDLLATSEKCDAYLRRTVRKLFENDELFLTLRSGELDEFMTHLVLGVRPATPSNETGQGGTEA